MSEIQIPEIICQNHGTQIGFLDLNKNVLIGQRVLCNYCHLMSPTNIQEALKKYKSYNDNQINIIERQDQLSCAPILKIKQQLQIFKKIMNNQLEKTLTAIGDLCQLISEEKFRQISQILESSQNLNLRKLQDIAQILSEDQYKEINFKNYFSTNQNIINQFQNLQTQLSQFDKNLNEFSNETKEMIEVVLPEKLQFYEANVLIKEGKSNQALDLLNRYLKENNYLHSSSLILRGQFLLYYRSTSIKYQNLNFEEIISYRQNLNEDPNLDLMHYKIGNKPLCKQENNLVEMRLFEEAIESYDSAIKINPNYSEAYFNKGNALWDLNQFEEAIYQYDQAIKIKPNYFWAQQRYIVIRNKVLPYRI